MNNLEEKVDLILEICDSVKDNKDLKKKMVFEVLTNIENNVKLSQNDSPTHFGDLFQKHDKKDFKFTYGTEILPTIMSKGETL